MKKILSLLLMSALTLSLCACSNTNNLSKKDINQTSSDTTVTENTEVKKEEVIDNKTEELIEKDATASKTALLEYGDIIVNIPEDIMKLITIKDGAKSDNPHIVNLFDIYESASIEAGQKIHPEEDWGDGWLFGIAVADQIGFEELLGMDIPGYSVIAQNDNKYYIYTHPTDVRLMREDNNYESGIKEWSMLCDWANSMKDTIVVDNDLLPVSIMNMNFTYDSDHKYFEYKNELTHNIIVLSQPVQQGENGIWCVERVEEYYNGEIMYTRLIFPIALGIEKTAHQYYVELQEAVDKGESLNALNYEKVLEEFLHSDAWYYEKTNIDKFVEIEKGIENPDMLNQ